MVNFVLPTLAPELNCKRSSEPDERQNSARDFLVFFIGIDVGHEVQPELVEAFMETFRLLIKALFELCFDLGALAQKRGGVRSPVVGLFAVFAYRYLSNGLLQLR